MSGLASDSITNKTGASDAVRNECGRISTNNGTVVIAALTYNKDRSWEWIRG